MAAVYFQGSVAQAVAASRAGFKPLLVLLAGRNAEGEAAERSLLSQPAAEHLVGSVVLRLDDDLASANPAAYVDARNFRAFCPTDALPTVALVSPSGATLALVKGAQQCSDAAALHAALVAGYEQIKQQQQAFLAAQAFAALAQRAQQQQGGPSPASAPVHQQTAAAPVPALEQPSLEAPQQPQPQPQPQPQSAADEELPPAVNEQDEAEMVEAGEGAASEPSGAAPAAMELEGGPASAGPDAGDGPAAAAGLAEEREEEMAEAAAGSEVGGGDAATKEPCSLHIRLPGGGTLASVFASGATLAAVFSAVDVELAGQAGGAAGAVEAYVLVQQHPRRQFGAAEEGQTLAELGIQPRTALVVNAAEGPEAHCLPTPLQPPAPAPEAAAAEAEAEAPLEPEPFTLQLRFTDGSALRVEQEGTAPLAEVFAAIDAHRSGGGAAVPYVLVIPHPKRQLGPAEAGQSLAALGLQPRTTLAVVPNKQGHVPVLISKPVVAAAAGAAAAPDASSWQGGGEQGAGTAAAGAPAAAAAAAGKPVLLQVRLTNGDVVRRQFDDTTTLAQVLDFVDENRTDGSKPYKVLSAYPQRTYNAGDLDLTLSELRLVGRASLQLDPLPPRPKPAAAKPPPAPAPAAAPAPPARFVLQFRQPDGASLRGEFAPDATLQEVRHYVDAHRTDGGGPYSLVQPFPKRRFGADEAELGQSLLALGLDPRSLLIMEPLAGSGAATGGSRGSWSLGGLLSSAAGYLNPLAYLRGPQLGDDQGVGTQAVATAAQQQLAGEPTAGSGEGERSQGGTRKRGFGQTAAASSNIHTLGHRGAEEGGGGRSAAQRGGGDGDEQNLYWNGNSTEFGGDDRKDG